VLSIRVTVPRTLPDLDRRWLDVECPHCRLATPVTLRDVRLGAVAICRGCKSNIHLVDQLGQYQQAKRALDRRLRSMFSRLGR
jgi:hypothetical protein